jgi:vacuolar-type H+-ATPase subunit I/STV1
MVSHPKHYDKGDSTYEPYKVIKAWNCNFNIGSAIKYLARYKDKWNAIEDLKKAKQYIDFEIESLKSEAETVEPVIITNHKTDDVRSFLDSICRNNKTEKHEEIKNDNQQSTKQSNDCEINTLVNDILQILSHSKFNNVIEKANKALDDGETRQRVMKDILGMTQEQIDEIGKIGNQEKAAEKFLDTLTKNMSNSDSSKLDFSKLHFVNI